MGGSCSRRAGVVKWCREMELIFDFRCTRDTQASIGQKTFTFDANSLPRTLNDITGKIEEVLEIPSNQTRVLFNSVTLDDTTVLDSLRLRSGDAFVVHYYSTAACHEVTLYVEWMKNLLVWLEKWRDDKTSVEIENIRGEICLQELSFTHFSPWETPDKYANKLYFIAKDGLEIVRKIMDILLDTPLEKLPKKLHNIECWVLGLLWNITEDDYILRATTKAGGLETCAKALLRVPVTPFKQLPYGIVYEAAKETIRKSLGAFANLCELPEIRLKIASNEKIIKQMLSITLCPSFSSDIVHRVVMTFLDLSYTRDTHPYLILQKEFLHFMRKEVKGSVFQFDSTYQLMSYHKSVLFAILLCTSPQSFDHEDRKFVREMLDKFTTNTTYQSLSLTETNRGVYWGTIAPLINTLYQPETDIMPGSYYRSCKLTIMLSLLTLLTRKYHHDVLVKEEMVEFVVCLPWFTDGEVQEKAKILVELMRRTSSKMEYQPPSLLNISKAAVSVHFCGLEDVTSLTVPELAGKLWKMYNT